MSGVVDNVRPPYVSFERRAVEDRTASNAAGHYMARDVDIATITRPGSRDTLDKEAVVWLKELQEKSRVGAVPAEWYPAFAASYKAWKEGEALPETGTPIKGWAVLSPAAQTDLIRAGIRTVEDLANLPDSELQAIGTGAVSYKQKAKGWLEAAEDKGKLSEKLANLVIQITALTDLTREQAEEIKNLRRALPVEPLPGLAKPANSVFSKG